MVRGNLDRARLGNHARICAWRSGLCARQRASNSSSTTSRSVVGDVGGGLVGGSVGEPLLTVNTWTGTPDLSRPYPADPPLIETLSFVIGPNLWFPPIHDWIWSVLDPAGACRIGGGECTLREAPPPGGSVCGDSHCTGVETLATCSSDCSAPLADADGDGLPDIRDLCPLFDARRADATIVDGQHADTNGDYVGDDCLPVEFDVCAPDTDGDGFGDDRDNCVIVANPDQADRDRDGIGDVCDRCPDATSTSPPSDRDVLPGDGAIPDGIWDECDVCPEVYDPDQANCNLDAELTARAREAADGLPEASWTPIRGDACDPTPCAETALGLQLTRFAEVADLTPGTIRVDAISDYTNVAAGTGRVTPAREGFRFCRCPGSALDGDTPRGRARCSDPVLSDVDPSIALGNCDVSDLEQYDRVVETALTWRWMTMPGPTDRYVRSPEPGGPAISGGLRVELPAVHEVRPPDALYTADLRFEWGWQVESGRWAGVFPGDPAPAASAGLEGVLWTHTARRRYGAAPTWDRNLSSHYWSGWLPMPYRAPGRTPICGGPVMPLPSSTTICPFCAGLITFPFAVGFRPCPFPDQFGVAFGDWTVLPEDLPPNEPFNRDDMAPLLGWDGRWLAAVEPPSQLPDRGLRFVGIRPDLGSIGRLIIETDAGFRDVLANCPVPGQCGDPIDPPPIQSALASRLTQSPTSPPSRTDFVGVVSAQRSELFVLGGRLSSGAAARDAWALDVLRNEWRRLDAASAALGDVLAATYDATTGDLIVIDEVSHTVRRRVERRARLLRVGPRDEAVEVMASWPRLTSNDRFSMAPGHDGSLYVAASNRGAHVVLHLTASGHGTFRIAGLAAGAGRIIPEQIHANRYALTLMVEHGRSFRARTYEEHDFLRVPTAAERCF